MSVPNSPQQRTSTYSAKRLIIALLVLVAVLFYVLVYDAKGAETVATVAKISPRILVLMIATYLLYVVIHGLFYRSIYQAVGISRKVREMSMLFLKMNLANTLAPVVGLSGAAYMIYSEQKRGTEQHVAVLINFLYYTVDYAVFLSVLCFGVGYLTLSGLITTAVLIPAVVFVACTLLFLTAGAFLFSHPRILYKAMAIILTVYERFRLFGTKGALLELSVTYADRLREIWLSSRSRWHYLGKAALVAWCQHIACIFLLYLAFIAVAVPVSIGTLVVGYTVGTLLHIVSITPGGIGFAEGGMTAMFVGLGIPLEQAVVVVLLYRSVFAGLPLLLAIPAMHTSSSESGNATPSGI